MNKAPVRQYLLQGLLIAVILLVFVSISIPRLSCGHEGHSRWTVTRGDLRSIQSALAAYRHDVGRFPESLQELKIDSSRTRSWKGPYVDPVEMFLDGWGTPYRYSPTGPHRIWSCGPDGIEGTEDDFYPD